MDDLHRGHRERLRLRLESDGLSGLQPHEILEFLLYYADGRGDTNPAAHALIERFGSLEDVLDADESELMAVKGVGPRGAAWLKRISAMMASYAALSGQDRPLLNNLRRVRQFAGVFLPPGDAGVWQLCLSRNGRLLLSTRVGEGPAWGESMCLREALGEVLNVQAHSVILVQFTGQRAPEIDAYDVDHTYAYAETLTAVDVRLVDHVLIGSGKVLSLAFEGQLLNLAQPTDGERRVGEYLAET